MEEVMSWKVTASFEGTERDEVWSVHTSESEAREQSVKSYNLFMDLWVRGSYHEDHKLSAVRIQRSDNKWNSTHQAYDHKRFWEGKTNERERRRVKERTPGELF